MPSRIGGDNGGDVVGPNTSTDEAIVRFNGITGDEVQDSTATITDTGVATFQTTTDSQAAFNVKNAGGSTILKLETLRPDLAVSAPDLFAVNANGYSDYPGSGVAIRLGRFWSSMDSGTQSNRIFGVDARLRFTGTAAITGDHQARGFNANVTWNSTGTADSLVGIQNFMGVGGGAGVTTGLIGESIANRALIGYNTNDAGSITDGVSFLGAAPKGIDANHTITNMYAFYAEDQAGTGVTDSYGLFIEDQTSPGFAIRTGTGYVALGDTTTITGSQDTVQLNIIGDAAQTADLVALKDSASLVQSSFSSIGGAHFNQQNEGLAVVRMDGNSENYVFYMDAAEDAIGLGTNEVTFTYQQIGGGPFTSNPRVMIEIGPDGNDTGFVMRSRSDTPAKAGLVEFMRAGAGETEPKQFYTVGGFRAGAWDGAKYLGNAGLFFKLDFDAATDYAPIGCEFITGDGATATYSILRGTSSGNVGLRTSLPSAPITAEGNTVFNLSQSDANFRIAGLGVAFPLYYDAGSAQLNFGGAASGSIMRLTEGAIDINRSNNPYDFRIRTQTYSKFFWVDGGLDVAGFGSTFGTEWLRISANAVTINETGDNATVFRVEGDTDQSLLRTSPSNNRVGVGVAAPLEKFHVGGNVRIGAGAAGTDYTLTFDGETNDGVITWMEDEDYFRLEDDLVFNTNAGLCFGEIYGADTSTTLTITGTGKANKVQITSFAVDGQSNNMTPDHTNDHITVDVAGKYLCTVSIHMLSTGGGGADNYGYSVYKNNGATEFANLHGQRDLTGGGGDEGSISLSGILDLAATDTVEVWIWNNTNTDDVIVDDINLSLVQIGG